MLQPDEESHMLLARLKAVGAACNAKLAHCSTFAYQAASEAPVMPRKANFQGDEAVELPTRLINCLVHS